MTICKIILIRCFDHLLTHHADKGGVAGVSSEFWGLLVAASCRVQGRQHARLLRPSPPPRLAHIRAPWVGDAARLTLGRPRLLCLQSFAASGWFPASRLRDQGRGRKACQRAEDWGRLGGPLDSKARRGHAVPAGPRSAAAPSQRAEGLLPGRSAVSDSVRPTDGSPRRPPLGCSRQGRWSGCHSLLQCVKAKRKVKSLSRARPFRPHGLQPTRPLRPWGFPGKSTGVGASAFSYRPPTVFP